MTGKVYLIGAGPGDPELLTVKAARLLRNADAVLHDDLVSQEILSLIPASAKTINVGKRCGTKSIRQEEINFLMIALASADSQVVRLKSGDPMIFGRAGEEIQALRSAGVAYEVVPGITSALGAAASVEIPLTDRRSASAVVFMTGHLASGKEQEDWSRLANSGATLVLYMPGNQYQETSARLTDAGVSPETSCVLISRASTPQQKVYRTTIQELAESPRLPAPVLLVVGDVVRYANAAAEPFFNALNLSDSSEAKTEILAGTHRSEL